jgi:hypothetical protein
MATDAEIAAAVSALRQFHVLDGRVTELHAEMALRAAEGVRMAERKRALKSMTAPEVEDSCGCVFCDMDLTPVEHEGKLQHHVRVSKRLRKTPPPESWVPCTKGETP